ncbi:MAG: hypothetical protein R3E66_03035 [bacterium]
MGVRQRRGRRCELNQNYPLHIRSGFGRNDQLSPEIGTACRRDSPGVCEMGTYLACENYECLRADGLPPLSCVTASTTTATVGSTKPTLTCVCRWCPKKQGAWSGWQSWLTFDTHGTSRQLLDYTPADPSDDRIRAPRSPCGQGEIQTSTTSLTLLRHRDLRNGRITFPFFHGKEGVTLNMRRLI